MSTTSTPQRPDAPVRTGDRPWQIVAGREIMAKLTDKGFVIGTIVSIALILGLLLFQLWFFGRSEHIKVAVTDDRGAQVVQTASDLLKQRKSKDVLEVVRVADHAEGVAALATEKAGALLEPGATEWALTFQKEPQRTLVEVLPEAVRTATVAQNAQKAGIDVAQLTSGTGVQVHLVQGDAQRAAIAMAVAMVFAVLFFMSALGFGMQIANSVVEEKQSRIVEILASAIPIPHLLAGKVLGNTVMALGQMVLYTGIGLLGLSLTDFKQFVPALSGAVGWYVVFFLAGFLALACVWAVAGSLASRVEDLQQTTTPLTLVLSVIYMASFFSEGAVKVVLSYVPVASSILMPVRLFEGTAQWWDALIAMALTLAFAAVTVWFGAKLYRASLLQVHGRVRLKDALAAAR